ncbi:MAG: 50S ribosomal protein L25 [Eubacteriales bacterium]|nr:50S ribosomal protein L25 [Eubacteriales bacterium]MDD3072811.1 50S ribosomal protein L25 [Eubacteriales bacterium]MDD4078345.1 50S ribosomal protein L25 [Eubacteriales bacterium]MDD4768849.1 50S ribosomal protein L25 [Eubacteriales bacterium]
MKRYTLKADIRADKGHKVRRDNLVPAVLYGQGVEPIHLGLPEADVKQFVQRGTANMLIDLTAGKKKYTVMLKDLQRHRVKGDILHMDFYAVDLEQKLTATVPVHLIGEPLGVKEGGVVQQQTREVEVRCLPTEIPQGFELDISALAIGDSRTVADLSIEGDFEILTPETEVVVSVLAPRLETEEEVETEETEEGQAEVPEPEAE